MKDNELLQIMDAKIWAEEFVKLHGGDEGLMLSWFANAIMCGHDHAGRQNEKQTRAEVLAACAKRAAIRLRDAEKHLADDDPKGTCAAYHRGEIAAIKYLGTEISELQPAAKDLEELLREEREKGRQEERKEVLYDVLAFNCGLGCTPQEGYKDLTDALRDTKHLAVEKARAKGKG